MTARAVALFAITAVLACAIRGGPPMRPSPVPVVVGRGTPRAATVLAEVVATPEDRARGLGGRKELAPNAGMLFVYDAEEPRTYWMKDCFLGLDIAFIGADRRILNVATLPPGIGIPDADVPRTASSGPARFVLETNTGWFARHGLGAGDEVDLGPALAGLSRR